MKCLSINFDGRIKNYVANIETTYGWYLNISQGTDRNFQFQRDVLPKKTYETLRRDIRRGCILPPLVIAGNFEQLPNEFSDPNIGLSELNTKAFLEQVANLISGLTPPNVQIIDGLQRTNALRDVFSELSTTEEQAMFNSNVLRLEIWLNIPLFSLAYRMLLLNAGQKPMSIKHQIEILADSMKTELETIPNLEIIRGLDHRRRTRPGQFQLSSLSGTFQAWLQKQPNIDIRSTITEQLLAEEAVESLGQRLSLSRLDQGKDFRDYIEWIVQLDVLLGEDNLAFLGNETVMLAFAAAMSAAMTNPELSERAKTAQSRLLADIRNFGVNQAFNPKLFDELRKDIDPKRKNVGEATRDLAHRAISEYIFSGTKNMTDCWTFAGSSL